MPSTPFQTWFRTYTPPMATSRSDAIKRLAEASGVSATTINTLIRGAVLKNADKAKALSAATGGQVTVQELLGL